MADVKWIKITTNIFDDEKIKLIDTMPDRDTLLVIWFKLLAMAGKNNDNGFVYIIKEMPTTDEMLATIFNRPLNTIRLALETFSNFGMIEINKHINIVNWEKHQNVNGLDKIKKDNADRQKKFREKKRLELLELESNNVTVTNDSNVTVTLRNDTEEEKKRKEKKRKEEKKKRKEEDINTSVNSDRINYNDFQIVYNSICKSLPQVKTITEKRKKLIKAIMKSYTLEQIKKVYEKAEESHFLSGRNGKWTSCNFDWLMNSNNFIKVLEDNYANKTTIVSDYELHLQDKYKELDAEEKEMMEEFDRQFQLIGGN